MLSFVLVAAAIFFLVVRPVNMLMARRRAETPVDQRSCPECRSEIPALARRCALGAAEVVPEAQSPA
jgi:large conductance mechanosensitive channel